MKYIKAFENNTEPEIGDYVVVTTFRKDYKPIKNFLETHIGRIDFTQKIYQTSYRVKFDESYVMLSPNISISSDCYWAQRSEILNFSKNKEDLKYIISANKYNL